MAVGENSTELVEFCAKNNIKTEGFSTLRGGCMKLPLVVAIAARHKVAPAEVCLRFVTQSAGSAVVSSSSSLYDKEDLASSSLVLSADEMAELAALGGS
jgi:diketogulonate reductase-like aldo/keto reductase